MRSTAYCPLPKALLFGLLVFWLGIALLAGCNEPVEQTTVPPVELPDVKQALTAYHPEEFLSTEVVSAPLLTTQNHQHGWQQADCKRCHRVPEASLAPEKCVQCHGRNGVDGHVDTCASCHQVTNEYGAPASGQHLAHVMAGPKDQTCVKCHPGRDSDVHANGILNITFKEGGTYEPTGDERVANCTVSCHEPRPWGGEGCSSCHGNPPETGVHTKHLEQKDITCRDCHLNNQHDDDKTSGTIELGGIEYNRITGDCTTSCHEKTEQWGCTGCHAYPPTTGNHSQQTHNLSCDTCHQGHDHSYQAAMQPLNFSGVEVTLAEGTYRDTTADGLANGTCTGVGCHEPRDWGTDCSTCHGNPPSSGSHIVHVLEKQTKCQECHQDNQHDLDVTSGAIEVGGDFTYNAMTGGCVSSCHEVKAWDCRECHGYPPATANHPSHADAKLKCQECHADHEHSFKMATASTDLSDAQVEFAQGGSFDVASGECSTPCHEVRVWGSSCADCHGNPPSTGYHEMHVASGATCDSCHAGREHDLDVTSGLIEVGGIQFDPFTGDCASNCHTGTERWDCSSCHGSPPETGAHQKHAVELKLGCHLCHQGHQHDYRATDPNNREFAPVKVGFTIRGNWDGKTCTSIGCHADRAWVQ